VPRRFSFRHPVVRHAVYAAVPGAWRLRAHARAAAALERRSAGPVERAHHVEHAAQRGDRAAIDLLADASQRVFEQAPATAARYLESALRLLPDDADLTAYRIELLQTRAYALLGAGQLDAAHGVLTDTLQLVPPDAWERRGLLICSQTSIEAWSGRPVAEPIRRLRAALSEEPGGPSLTGFALRMPLASLEFLDLRLDRAAEIATEALAHARDLGDRRLEHDIADIELGQQSLGFWDLGWALGFVGRYEEALSQLRRAVTIDRRSGHGYLIPVLLATQLNPLIQLGRLTEAVALGEEAVEATWTSSNPGRRLGAHGDLALARHLSGDTDGAQHDAHEAVRLASEARLWRARAGWTLGLIQADSQPEAGIATILQAAGGWELPDVVTAERPLVWAALTEAHLHLADMAGAARGRACPRNRRRRTRPDRRPPARRGRTQAGRRRVRALRSTAPPRPDDPRAAPPRRPHLAPRPHRPA